MMMLLRRLLFFTMVMALLPTAMAFTTSSSLISFQSAAAVIHRVDSSSSSLSRSRRLSALQLLLGRTHPTSTTTAVSLSTSSSSVSTTATASRANQPTELPDSLDDAASIAAKACYEIYQTSSGGVSSATPNIRCRVDFDTSIGDETYTLLKSSTEFTQKFVSALCMLSIDGVQEYMLECATRLAVARVELKEVKQQLLDLDNGDDNKEEETDDEFGDFLDEDGISVDIDNSRNNKDVNDDVKKTKNDDDDVETKRQLLVNREMILLQTIADGGSDSSTSTSSSSSSAWTGPQVRIYFPDEGSAALARRDWSITKQKVPPCVEFGSVGGQQPSPAITSNDVIIIFICPRASESDDVERILYNTERTRGNELLMSIMINPLLVDMGVTGFGMAGRRLRERLIDGLIPAYYLRTLSWGAITRVWPQLFTVWKEDDENVIDGGYSMLQAMDRLPSNPEGECKMIYTCSNTHAHYFFPPHIIHTFYSTTSSSYHPTDL
jgi:hypothetical protein